MYFVKYQTFTQYGLIRRITKLGVLVHYTKINNVTNLTTIYRD